jgi:hypothetical protein
MAPLARRPLLKLPAILISAACRKGCVMDSWYVSLVPASVAVAIIGYSLFIAYA